MEDKIVTEVQIIPIKPREGLVAFASFVFCEAFYMGSIGIMTRPEGGYRLAYPTRELKSGPLNVFHPINKDVAQRVEGAIIEKYERIMKKKMQEEV